ncbi:helix-turn-helix transcriptional regulator [Oceanobacillus neutriphilus]|uniref:YheO-like PAS domain protein n=1 Tax=Oceanobacillus neutriphilus TaxID=531815 RepID=A0ABQ2NNE2_9BACI|nr:PAS domain-containing protein [Oceanobacillus neutriphilus]GGP07723.1 hypothetical protein GCM10011346_04840 [Oceanobacillus neutriphilus]
MSILNTYIPFIEFMGKSLGSDAEIILYDAQKSQVAYVYNARNENVSVGSPMPSIEKRFLEQGIYEKESAIINYRAFSADHSKLRSSTYFIKGNDGELAGIVTINFKVDELIELRSLINRLINGTETTEHAEDYYESFDLSFEDLMHKTIQEVMNKTEVPPERMSTEEKIELIRALDEKGLFLLKGSVAELSKVMNASETSIYRYISKL